MEIINKEVKKRKLKRKKIKEEMEVGFITEDKFKCWTLASDLENATRNNKKGCSHLESSTIKENK